MSRFGGRQSGGVCSIRHDPNLQTGVGWIARGIQIDPAADRRRDDLFLINRESEHLSLVHKLSVRMNCPINWVEFTVEAIHIRLRSKKDHEYKRNGRMFSVGADNQSR